VPASSLRLGSRGDAPRRVSVCVATLGRPQGLASLLGALELLELPVGTELRVVVVDNDPRGSARAICAEAAERHAYALHYAIEKRRGISFARNAAIAAALRDSDFIAFTDDDAMPEPDWLAELLRVQDFYRAHVVTGPSLPRYEQPPPRWVSEGGFHEKPRHPTGTRCSVAHTGNALVRTSVFECLERHFDESLALSGGEDVEFFARASAAGFQIVWADNAIVHESVPASRATLRWILQRAFRVGSCASWVEARHRSRSALRGLAHATYCIAKGAALACALPLRGRAAAAEGLRLCSFGLGRIAGACGHLHPEYRAVHAR
jgi:GT2 family glycosyltransferase